VNREPHQTRENFLNEFYDFYELVSCLVGLRCRAAGIEFAEGATEISPVLTRSGYARKTKRFFPIAKMISPDWIQTAFKPKASSCRYSYSNNW
jgi:hypothetical protein